MTGPLGVEAADAAGAAAGAAWGEGVSATDEVGPGGSEHLPSEIDLGGGIKLKISPDAFRTIMHNPVVTAQVAARCQELTDRANSMAITEGAEYEYYVSNNPDNIRARGRVRPGNYKAVVDDDAHSTLLKALASVGSDPLPTYTASLESPPEMSPVPGAGAALSGGEAEAAAVAGDVAEVAVVAAL